jgi:hypothetical protein
MGRVRIPPLPQNIVMTERFTGIKYFLTHTGSAGSLALNLSTSIPITPDTTVYGPYDGPYVTGDVRLYIQSATLQAEPIAPGSITAYGSQRVLTRRSNERRFLQISVADNWVPGDSFIYTEIQV